MANLANIMNNLQAMGPVFWAGAAAIAMGGTLLIVSVLTMLRRLKLASPGFNRNLLLKNKIRKTPIADTASSSSGTARKTETGYEPTVFPLKNQEPVAEKNTSSQIPFELTDRLHRAADTLEEIINGLQKENSSNNFSPLKDDTESVEYLFKTTVG